MGACAMLLGVLLLALLQPGAAGATCYRVDSAKRTECFGKSHEPKSMELNIDFEGRYVFGREQSGVDQNACGNGSGTTPNHLSADLDIQFHVDWDHVVVPFGPVHGSRRVLVYESQPTDELAGSYHFSGFAYNESCSQLSWPAGGGSCSGVFKATEPVHSLLFVNLPDTPKPNANHVNIEITPIAIPTPGLSVAPAGCEDNGSPPGFHSFEGAFGAEIHAPDTSLSLDVAKSGHSIGAYAFTEQRNVPDTVTLPASFVNNCSEPAAGLTCSQGWDPPNAEEETGHGEVFVGRERLK
jgi:hypothetical protein